MAAAYPDAGRRGGLPDGPVSTARGWLGALPADGPQPFCSQGGKERWPPVGAGRIPPRSQSVFGTEQWSPVEGHRKGPGRTVDPVVAGSSSVVLADAPSLPSPRGRGGLR